MAFLSQAVPLGGLLPPHTAFQEHAAHPPEWPGELSSKGSSDTCISEGACAHSYLPLSRHTVTNASMTPRKASGLSIWWGIIIAVRPPLSALIVRYAHRAQRFLSSKCSSVALV